MDIKNLLKVALYEQDGQRDRSQQTALGASSVGGCRRQAWNILNAVPKTNPDTEHLAAIIGTALHASIAGAMEAADPFGDDFLIEQGFETELLDLSWESYADKELKAIQKAVTCYGFGFGYTIGDIVEEVERELENAPYFRLVDIAEELDIELEKVFIGLSK